MININNTNICICRSIGDTWSLLDGKILSRLFERMLSSGSRGEVKFLYAKLRILRGK